VSPFKQIFLLFSSKFPALLTFVRGIALEKEQPLFTITPVMVFTAALTAYGTSVGLAQVLWTLKNPWLYGLFLPIFAIGQSAAWTLYMVSHHAVHDGMSRKAWVNEAIAEIASIIGMTLPPDIYRKLHNFFHHNRKVLATKDDPDYKWLRSLGFVAGQPIDYYWRLMGKTLVSPQFYAKNFWKRCQKHLTQSALPHQIAVILWWIAVGILTYTFSLWAGLVMYAIILIVGYPISALLQTLSEHRWLYVGHPSRKTFPRLLPIDQHPKMFWVYLYWRSAILSTDLAQHQIHHYKARNLAWPMVAYSSEAQKDLDQAIWGIKAQFIEAFTALSEAAPE
jgi:fatty acid desaturase